MADFSEKQIEQVRRRIRAEQAALRHSDLLPKCPEVPLGRIYEISDRELAARRRAELRGDSEEEIASREAEARNRLWRRLNPAGSGKPQPAPRGAKPKISDHDLIGRRAMLIASLEMWWPWIGPELLKARDAEAVAQALRRPAEANNARPARAPEFENRVGVEPPGTYGGPELNALAGQAGALAEFLQSPRFIRRPKQTNVRRALLGAWQPQPGTGFSLEMAERQQKAANCLPFRQIANAMAGVPEIGWRQSLERCAGFSAPQMIANGQRWYPDLIPIRLAARLWAHATYRVPISERNDPRQRPRRRSRLASVAGRS